MAIIAGPLITDILKNIRDEAGSGSSRTLVRSILSHAQRLVNFIIEDVVKTATLTLEPKRLAYPASQLISDYLKTLSITHNGNDLARGTLGSLSVFDSYWPRAVDFPPSMFIPIGLDVLLIYPASELKTTVDVTYVADTQDIVGDSSEMDVSDHAVPLVKDVATALLLLRQRDFDVLPPILARLSDRLKRYSNE